MILFISAFFCFAFLGCHKATGKESSAVKNKSSKNQEYTIAFISDTQFYSQSNPEIFNSMTQYLVDNSKPLNLQYIVHTGDIVEIADDEQQWINAKQAMEKIKHIPHGVLAGNHDTSSGPTFRDNYHKYFGAKFYKDCSWYGENRNDNDDHYDLIKIGNTEFIFVYLSDSPKKESIDFANKAFQKYYNRVGVLCVHNYLDTVNDTTEEGARLKKEVVAKNENVKIVLCGHRIAVGFLPAYFDDNGDGKDDRVVYQIISNTQTIRDGGYLMLLKYNEEKGFMSAYTYSPYKDDYLQGESGISMTRFTFKVPW